MADIIFQGPAALTMDDKGRISMPVRHRELLAALGEQRLTVTKNPEGSLMIFPRSAWHEFRDRVMGLPMAASGWKRVFLGNAVDVDIDASSRIMIAPELRDAAGIKPKSAVMLIGMGSHLELWDAPRYAAHEASVLQSEMPDALKSFVF